MSTWSATARESQPITPDIPQTRLARFLSAMRPYRRDKAAVLGMAILILLGGAALAAPLLAPAPPFRTDLANLFAGPSLTHPLGTDQLGRDVLSRLLYGARRSLGVTLVATAGITAVGLVLGLLSAASRGIVDAAIMRTADVFQSLPTLIVLLVAIGFFGEGLGVIVVAIVALRWETHARVVRVMALSIRERGFVEASRALGAGRVRRIYRHVLPHVLGPVVVLSTLQMGGVLLSISALSFLGFGVDPSVAEWGAMLAAGRNYLTSAPQLIIYPGIAITVAVLAFNLLGDGMRDFLDTRTRARTHQ